MAGMAVGHVQFPVRRKCASVLRGAAGGALAGTLAHAAVVKLLRKCECWCRRRRGVAGDALGHSRAHRDREAPQEAPQAPGRAHLVAKAARAAQPLVMVL
eukprot:363393-Chlamydomonas_euryale.AAC.8